MEYTNDLRGLHKGGFSENTDKFNEEIFSNNNTVDLIRCEIRKYLTKSKKMYRRSSSYGLKHTLERHIGSYVSNGE